MKAKEVVAKLTARKAKLEEILKTYNKSTLKYKKLTCYISELESLITSIVFVKKEIYAVSPERLNSIIKKSDFVAIEDEGSYFSLSLVQNYPYQDIYILCLARLTSL